MLNHTGIQQKPRKIKKFLLTEKKANKESQNRQQPAECISGPSTQLDQPGLSSTTHWAQPAKNPRPQRKPQQPKRKGTARTKKQRSQTKNLNNARRRRR